MKRTIVKIKLLFATASKYINVTLNLNGLSILNFLRLLKYWLPALLQISSWHFIVCPLVSPSLIGSKWINGAKEMEQMEQKMELAKWSIGVAS